MGQTPGRGLLNASIRARAVVRSADVNCLTCLSNIVIYVLMRRPLELLATFNANASRIAISSITLAELMHGAEKSERVNGNLVTIRTSPSSTTHACSTRHRCATC